MSDAAVRMLEDKLCEFAGMDLRGIMAQAFGRLFEQAADRLNLLKDSRAADAEKVCRWPGDQV